MAQINLLRQQTQGQTFLKLLPSLVTKLLVVLVLAVIGYYVWLWFQINSVNQKIVASEDEFAATERKVVTVSNRDEIYTRQAQLKEYGGLLSSHLYWSNLFPALAKVTLKQASYSSIMATKEGDLTVTVNVPDLDNLDKFLQVFNQSEFNKNFYNLKIGDFRLVKQDNQQYFSFEAQLKFNPALFHYQSANKGAN